MIPRLLAMLTFHDRTVENAIEVFETCKEIPLEHWGFKDIGLDLGTLKALIDRIKSSGKMVVFEVLSETEEECQRAARLAVELELDFLIGMKFFDSVHEMLRNGAIRFFPTCGIRTGIPRLLKGSIEGIIQEAKEIEKRGVEGIALSAYRYTGDPEELMRSFLQEIRIPTIISGSINTWQKLEVVKSLRPWGITMGSAFFNRDFGKDLTIREQIEKVMNYLRTESQ